MNWQFYATAGIVSALLLIVAIIFCVIGYAELTPTWDSDEACCKIGCIILLSILAFWVIVGTISLLSNIWGWGLVV